MAVGVGRDELNQEQAPRAFAAGRYVVERVLGAGGQKTVFLARDTALERACAISWLAVTSSDEAERLRSEARALARMGAHPRIVTIYDIGEEAGRPYVVCELVAGGDLAQEIDRAGGKISVERAITIGSDVLRGLAAVHDQGVIHRDLKPSNVWLDAGGRAKIGDFGLALSCDASRITRSGAIAGTPAYLSPEQLDAEPIDARADLYSYGCMLYEALAGRLPFTGPLASILSQHLHATPSAPSVHSSEVPAELDHFVLRLLSKRPSARPGSAAAALIELEQIASAVAARLASRATEPASAGLTLQATYALPPSRSSSELVPARARPLEGRSRELHALVEALDDAAAGRGSLVFVTGEAGIGKSRLASQVAIEAGRRGFFVAWGRCWEAGGAPPFWPWVEVLRALVDSIPAREAGAPLQSSAAALAELLPEIEARFAVPKPASMGLEADRFRLFDAVASFLLRLAVTRPLLLLLDDLHAADAPTLLLLAFVAQRVGGGRVVIVGNYRDAEARLDREIGDQLTKAARHARTLPLRRLEPADVASIVASSSAARAAPSTDELARRVFEATEGNPLFIEEVLRLVETSAAEGVMSDSIRIPDGVRGAIRENLSGLEPASRTALELASVIGRTFTPAVLAGASGSSLADAKKRLRDPIRRGVVADAGQGRLTFSHVLLRDVLYDEMTDNHRAAAHLAVATTLEQEHTEAPLAEVAHHLMLAGAGAADRAIAKSVEASRRAAGQLAPEQGVALLERALETIELSMPSDAAKRCELLIALGTARLLATDVDRGQAASLEAADLARRLGDPELLARAALSYGARFQARRVDATMIGLLQEALARLGDQGSPTTRAMLLSRLAAAMQPAGDPRERVALGRRAIELVRDCPDRATVLAVHVAAGFGYWDAAAPEERVAHDQATLALAAERGDKLAALFCRSRLTQAFVELADMPNLHENLRAADAMESAFVTAHMRPHHGAMIALLEGRFADAKLEADRARSGALSALDPSGRVCLPFRDYFHALVRDERAAVVAAAEAVIHAFEPLQPGTAEMVRALSAARAGALDGAGESLARRGLEPPLSPAEFWLAAEACWLASDRDWADAAYPASVARTDLLATGGAESGACLGPTARSAMLLALTLDRQGDAEAHYRTCIRLCDRVGARPALALIREEYARALDRRGDTGRARELAREALPHAHALGMHDLIARLQTILT